MHKENPRNIWQTYCAAELERITPLLRKVGFTLEEKQPHLSGERYLQSPHKLVLLGKRVHDNLRVIIKISSNPSGIREIEHERRCRRTLVALKFAYQNFFPPEEILFSKHRDYVLFITSYIEQKTSFVGRPLKEQFSLALRAFKMQESAHAATYAHLRTVRRVFEMVGAPEYLSAFKTFMYCAQEMNDKDLTTTLTRAELYLTTHQETVEQYCGFLTHADFVPHNFRVAGEKIYLLDYASLHFGNKHENWARFLNFMLLYNRPLEQALTDYVRLNRSTEEVLSLKLMRIYKVAFLLQFYCKTLQDVSKNTYELTRKRIYFWRQVLESLMADTYLPEEIISSYKTSRDALRSQEERERQRDLH